MRKKQSEPKRPEKDIQSGILYILRLKGAFCLRVNQGLFKLENADGTNRFFKPTDIKGVSDIIAFHDDKAVFLEVKRSDGKQNKNQVEFERAVKACGMRYYIVRNIEDALDATRFLFVEGKRQLRPDLV